MNINELTAGADLYIDIERGGKLFTLKGKLLDIKNNKLDIGIVFEKAGEVRDIKETDNLYIRHIKMKKVFRFRVFSTTKKVDKNVGIFYEFDVSFQGEYFNRREAYRVCIGKEAEQASFLNGVKINDFYIKDLSILGVGFVSTRLIEVGEYIQFIFRDTCLLKLYIKVVRRENLGDKYGYGAIITKYEGDLNRYVYMKQVEEIKKMG